MCSPFTPYNEVRCLGMWLSATAVNHQEIGGGARNCSRRCL